MKKITLLAMILISINVLAISPPSCLTIGITQQPGNTSSCAGQGAFFSILAEGTNLTYQWQVNQGAGFSNLSNTIAYNGVTSSFLSISSIPPGLGGSQYRCVVTDSCANTSTSNAATLTVSIPPIVSANSATIVSGGTAVLTATGATTYIWHIGGPMGDPTNPISLSPTSTTTYTVTGTSNGCSIATTATITVTIPGVTGATGPTGLTGATGAMGVTGADGIQGATGATGVQGVQGNTGATGVPGATGTDGIQGVNGLTGTTGAMGTTGADGIQGATGQQGIQGEIGVIGTQGIQGNTGAMGITGATGADGALNAWGKGGTAGTIAGVDFFGTTDAKPLDIRTNSIQRVVITPGGNVGIGGANPSGLLSVGASSQFSVNSVGDFTRIKNVPYSFPIVQGVAGSVLLNDGSGNLAWVTTGTNGSSGSSGSNGGGGGGGGGNPNAAWSLSGSTGTIAGIHYIGTADNVDLVLKTNHTEHFRINALGNIGVGTSAPQAKLDVNGNIKVSGSITTPTINATSINTSNFKVNDTLRVSRIAALPGDSIIALGVNTLYVNQNQNRIFWTPINNNGTKGITIANGFFSQAKGVDAMALGSNALAQGDYSVALGNVVTAFGLNSIAIGHNVGVPANASGPNAFVIGSGVNSSSLMFNNNANSLMIGFNSTIPTLFVSASDGAGTTGNVGIGTTTIPQGYKLSVKGKIICEEVNVKLFQNWPDYVFDKKHKLMSIEELQEFTKKEKHLPDMPTASEVEKGGVNVSDMITKLLKAQEELTLYIIEQNKKIIEQNKRIVALENNKN